MDTAFKLVELEAICIYSYAQRCIFGEFYKSFSFFIANKLLSSTKKWDITLGRSIRGKSIGIKSKLKLK